MRVVIGIVIIGLVTTGSLGGIVGYTFMYGDVSSDEIDSVDTFTCMMEGNESADHSTTIERIPVQEEAAECTGYGT